MSGIITPPATQSRLSALPVTIDGGGAPVLAGTTMDVVVPFDCTVTAWEVLADQSGSIVIDVWKAAYSAFPPSSGNAITGTEKPTLAAAQKATATTLAGWTTALAAGDILRINVVSAATVQRVVLNLSVLASAIPSGGGPAAVTAVSASGNLASTGGTTPAITHNQQSGVSGAWTNPNVTVDAAGHITAIASGVPGGSPPIHASTHAPGGSDRVYYDRGHEGSNAIRVLRRTEAVQNATLTSGAVHLSAFTPDVSLTVNQVIITAGSSAFSALTYAAVGLYTLDASDNATLVAQTGDIHATAVATGTSTTANFLSSPTTKYGCPLKDATGVTVQGYAMVRGQRYALGVLCVGTMGSIRGISPGATIIDWWDSNTWNGTAGIYTPFTGKHVGSQSSLPSSIAVGTGSNTSILLSAVFAP